jgi:hypothetical protein
MTSDAFSGAGKATRFMQIPYRSWSRAHASAALSSRRSATYPNILVHIVTRYKQPLVFKRLFPAKRDALPPSYQIRKDNFVAWIAFSCGRHNHGISKAG